MKKGLLLFFVLITLSSVAQEHENHNEFEHHKNEIGVANAVAYIQNEKEWVYGLHLHATRGIGHSKFGLGLGYERLFDEHGHNTFSLVGQFRPIENWTINVSPGIILERVNNTTLLDISAHFEVTYEIEVGNFHIGPVAEIALETNDIHYSLGIHTGFGF